MNETSVACFTYIVVCADMHIKYNNYTRVATGAGAIIINDVI